MWISSLRARGLAGPPGAEPADLERAWGRRDRLGTPEGPVVDALRLLAAGLDPARGVDAARALGWEAAAEPDAAELRIHRPHAVRRALAPAPRPQAVVEVEIEVDPPLFGRLREAVVRDPRLAEGLATGRLVARVGWLFTPDHEVASLDRLGVALGDVAIPLGETPAWVAPLLADLGRRVLVVGDEPLDAVLGRWADALLGPDPDAREAASAALDALAHPAFGHGPLALVRSAHGVELAWGRELRPIRWAGEAAIRHARLVEAVYVARPDVLVVPGPVSDEVASWLQARTDGEDATLEQVLCAGELA